MNDSRTVRLQRIVRSEKGFTLVELLATIVILGIIAAIAVPAIGNILEGSKRDAHVANAEQIIEAARLMVTAEGDTVTDGETIRVSKLVSEGFLNSIPDVPGEDYKYSGKSAVKVNKDGSKVTFSIYLKSQKGDIIGSTSTPIAQDDLDPEKVKLH